MTERADMTLEGAVRESMRRLAARGHAAVGRAAVAAAWSEALYPEFEARVGERLSRSMSSDQLDEFERLVESGDDAKAGAWVHQHAPDHPAVVAEEFERLISEAVAGCPAQQRSGSGGPRMTEEIGGGDRGHGGEWSETQHLLSVLRYPLESLVRDDHAGVRSVAATRRLVRLVAEFDAASTMVIDLRTTATPGRLEAAIELSGEAAAEVTRDDLRAALRSCAVVGPATEAVPGAPDIAVAYELDRIASWTAEPEAPAADLDSAPAWTSSPALAVPLPNEADAAESLLAAMARSEHPVWVRTVLTAADNLGASIVGDDLRSVLTKQDVAEYLRVPVRARTVVVSATRVPVAVRAALRLRGSGLRLTPINARAARTLWEAPHSAVLGSAVGELHAVALCRVPSAGSGARLGMVAERPPVPDRPLAMIESTDPVRLGRAEDPFGAPVDAALDASDFLRHVFIEGRSGSGKTATVLQLFRSLTDAGSQVVYLDPHGDGASRAAAYASCAGTCRTLYVRHGDREHPVPLNPLADADEESRERALSDLLELIQTMLDPRREGMVGERFKRTFTLVAQAASYLPGRRTSITDVLAISLKKESLHALARAITPVAPDAAARLQAELVALGEKEFADLVSWFVSRLQPFLRTPTLRRILGTGADAVDALELMDRGDSLIVDLASPVVGEDVARVLGALWLLKIRAAMGRRRTPGRPVVLLVDEAHLYTFGALPGLLAEARKFGIGVVVATQTSDNLSPQLVRALEANCGSSISLRVGINAAEAASTRLGGWPPSELTRLPDLTAAASFSRSGMPSEPFTLHIDHFDRAAQEGWTTETVGFAADALAARTLDELWAPYADLEVFDDEAIADRLRSALHALNKYPRTPGGDTPQHRAEPQSSAQHDKSDRTSDLLDAWQRARAVR